MRAVAIGLLVAPGAVSMVTCSLADHAPLEGTNELSRRQPILGNTIRGMPRNLEIPFTTSHGSEHEHVCGAMLFQREGRNLKKIRRCPDQQAR